MALLESAGVPCGPVNTVDQVFAEPQAKHRGLEVRILDLNFQLLKRTHTDPAFDHKDWPQVLEEALDEFDPYVVGVSCLFDVGIKPMIEVMRRVRARGRSVVIAGGVIATYESKNLLGSQLAHFVVRGEGENKLNFLFDQVYTQGFGHKATPGIFFDDGNGILESAGPPDVVDVPDEMRMSHDLVPIEDYARYGSLNPFTRRGSDPSAPFAAIQFARGCRAECTFCAVRDFMGKGVRARRIDSLLEEMEYLYSQRGVRHFEWLDDDFLFYRKEVKILLQAIVDRKWEITWSANNGLIAASIDDELMDLISRSGCIGFKIGIETGNEEMLRKVKKPGKHDKFLKFSHMLDSYPRPFVGGNFIVGLPRETILEMMDTFRFALEVNLDWAAITVCQIIRGASAFSDAGEYFEDQMKGDGKTVKNFIPTRQNAVGVGVTEGRVLRNMDVFRLNPALVPDEEQVKEIWFAFNLIINYVNNKNLRTGGRPEKFINWVRTAQRAYPTNPYMMLFLGLAYRLKGEDTAADECHAKARKFADSDYWRDRFAAFHLDDLLTEFPATASDVHHRLDAVWRRQADDCRSWLVLPRGQAPNVAA